MKQKTVTKRCWQAPDTASEALPYGLRQALLHLEGEFTDRLDTTQHRGGQ